MKSNFIALLPSLPLKTTEYWPEHDNVLFNEMTRTESQSLDSPQGAVYKLIGLRIFVNSRPVELKGTDPFILT